MNPPTPEPHRLPAASGDDPENCKGQCGYTPWCKACMEEAKQTRKLQQALGKEPSHDDG